MPRAITLNEALELLDTIDLHENDSVDIVVLPPEDGVSDQEEIDDNENSLNFEGIIPREVSGILEVGEPDEQLQDVPSTSRERNLHESNNLIDRAWVNSFNKDFHPKQWKRVSRFLNAIPSTNDVTRIPEDLQNETLSPRDFFSKIMDAEVIELITNNTKLYAMQKGNMHFQITPQEICQFLGIILVSGFNQQPSQEDYWSTDPALGCKLIYETMSRRRFMEIKRYLHVVDNENLPQGKLCKVTPLYEMLNKRLQQYGIFHEVLSIDESMVPYHGRHQSKMFIKSKPIRFGFKIWCLCGSNGYPYAMQIYTGKLENSSEVSHVPLGSRVVCELLECVPNPSAHSVYFDNFFTSYKLLASLKDLGIKATGTVRENRTGNCTLAPSKDIGKNERGYYDYRSDGRVFVCKWKDNKAVCMASNFETHLPIGKAKRWSTQLKQRIEINQPRLISSYNVGMGGVDLLDKLLGSYRPTIVGKKYWFPLFINAVNVATVAAFRLKEEAHGKVMTHLEFRKNLAASLCKAYYKPRLGGPTVPVNKDVRNDGEGHFLQTVSQGRCAKCKKNTRLRCVKCDKRLHLKCSQLFHKA